MAVLERCLSQLDAGGRGAVVWGSVKGGSVAVIKSAVYQAMCSGP